MSSYRRQMGALAVGAMIVLVAEHASAQYCDPRYHPSCRAYPPQSAPPSFWPFGGGGAPGCGLLGPLDGVKLTCRPGVMVTERFCETLAAQPPVGARSMTKSGNRRAPKMLRMVNMVWHSL